MVIELSGVQFGLKLYVWFQNRTSAQREFDLKSQVWFQTKIARYEVQLPLYYMHFEITQIQDLVRSSISLMQCWAGLKSNHPYFWDFKIEQVRSASSIWNHKYDFRPKLRDSRFNYHFITSILKSPKYRTWSVQIFCWCSTEPVWN